MANVSGIGGMRGSCAWRPFDVGKCMFGSMEGYERGGEGVCVWLECVSASALPKSGGGGLNGLLTLWVVSSTNRHCAGLSI